MININVLIKPSSSLCNIKCEYCFYNTIAEEREEACDMVGHCSIQNVIEADGSVYPCDSYVYDQWKLGNIKDNSFEEMVRSDIAMEFLNTSLEKSDKCKVCKWSNICRGECRRKRENSERLNTLCEGYYDFFEYTSTRLMEVAMKVRNNQL